MTPITPEMIERALSAFTEVINTPIMEPCAQCNGVGYHGFGSVGPDWCNHCGGNQYNIRPGEELRAMRAALTAALGEGVTGWRIVPVEPTDEMYLAALRITRDASYGLVHDATGGAVYRAMLAASPAPSQDGDNNRSRTIKTEDDV